MAVPATFGMQAARQAGGNNYGLPPLTPQEEESFLQSIGSRTISGLGAVGNFLDIPGSMLRDVASTLSGTPANPFDQLLSPFGSDNRTGGRDLLEQWGLADQNTQGFDWGDLAGFGAEVLGDPLSYATFGASALGKGGQLAKRAGVLDDLLTKAAPNIGKRVGRMRTTLDDLLKHADDAQIGKLDEAARGMGVDSLEAFRAQHGSDSLGGLMGIGMPFSDPMMAVGKGEMAQKVGGAMDRVGEALRYGEIPGTEYSPGQHMAQLFDSSVRGLKGKYEQELGQQVSEAAHVAEVSSRYDVQPWVKATDDYFRDNKITDPSDKFKAFEDIGRAIETGRPLPKGMEKIQPQIDDYKVKMADQLASEQAEGAVTTQLADEYVDYMYRQMHIFDDDKTRKSGGFGSRLVSGKHGAQNQRREFLRGLAGGSDLINRLSKDADLSGVWASLPPGEKTKEALDKLEKLLNKKMQKMGISDDAYTYLKDQVQHLQQGRQLAVTPEMVDTAINEGVDAAKVKELAAAGDATGILKLLHKQSKAYTNQTFEHSRDLAQWLANLNPRHAKDQIAAFPHNPLEIGQARLAIGRKAVEAAKLARSEVAKHGTYTKVTAPGGAVKLTDLFESLGLDKQKSLDLFRDKQQPWVNNVRGSGEVVSHADEVRAKIAKFREYQGGMKSAQELEKSEAGNVGQRLAEIVGESSKRREAAALQRQIEELGYDPKDLPKAQEDVFKLKMEQWQDPVKRGERQFRRQFKHLIPKAGKDVDADSISPVFDEIADVYRNLTGKKDVGIDDVLEALKGKDPKPVKSDPKIISEAEDILRQHREMFDPSKMSDMFGVHIDNPDESLNFLDEAAPLREVPEYTNPDGMTIDDMLEEGMIDEDLAGAMRDPHPLDKQVPDEAGNMQTVESTHGEEAQKLYERLNETGESYKNFRSDWKRSPTEAAREAASDTTKQFEDVWVDGDFAESMKAGIESFKNPSYIEDMASKIIDPLNRIWQASVTRAFPSFHFRNAVAGQVQNKVAGGFSLKSFFDSIRAIQGKEMKSLDNIPYYKSRGLKGQAATDELNRLVFSENLIDKGHGIGLDAAEGTMLNKEMAGQIPGQRPHSITENLGYLKPKLKDAEGNWNLQELNPLNTEQFAPYQWGTDTGQFIESTNRITAFIEYMRKGMSPAEAARRVRMTQFDYKDLTKAEKAIFKRAIPFWTFSKNQAKFTFDELSQRPGGMMAQFGIRAPNSGREDGQPLPEYLSQTAAIGLGKLPDGSDRYLTGFGLAHEDPLSFLSVRGGMPDMGDTVSELLSRTSPLIKYPIEAATGESFFQRGPLGGRELQDMDPTMGRLLTNVGLRDELPGGKAKPVVSSNFENLVSNSPAARLLTTARGVTDPRKRESTGGVLDYLPGQAMATNLLTGMRLSDLSPAARKTILREESSAMMKEGGAKSWENVIFSKAQVTEAAKSDPETAREMIKFNRLQRYLENDGKKKSAKKPKLAKAAAK